MPYALYSNYLHYFIKTSLPIIKKSAIAVAMAGERSKVDQGIHHEGGV